MGLRILPHAIPHDVCKILGIFAELWRARGWISGINFAIVSAAFAPLNYTEEERPRQRPHGSPQTAKRPTLKRPPAVRTVVPD